MAKNLSNLNAPKGANSNKKRVGRGMGSGIGKTSGRGHKGQRSRSGSRMMRGFEGGQMPLHRRMPKRGFTNIFRTEYTVLNLSRIAEMGEGELTHERLLALGLDKIAELVAVGSETELTLETLQARGVVKGRNKLVKVLANGEISSAVTVHAHKFSASAQKAIEAAGGKAVIIGAEAAAA